MNLTSHPMADTLTVVALVPGAIQGQGPPVVMRHLAVEAAVATMSPAVTIRQARRAAKALILVAVRLHCTIILPLIIMHFIPPSLAPPPPLPPPTCLA